MTHERCAICQEWNLIDREKCWVCDYPEVSADEARKRGNFWLRGPGYIAQSARQAMTPKERR